MVKILETERLTLRQFGLTDAGFILKLVNSPGWIEFIGDRNIKTEEAAIKYLQDGPLKSYQENGFGLWLVETTEGISIGMCGILKRDYLENPDIGFAFLPEFMNKGYAFEISTAVINLAKEKLKLPIIFAITVSKNFRSIRLLEKMGFVYSKTIYTPDEKKEELMLFGTN